MLGRKPSQMEMPLSEYLSAVIVRNPEAEVRDLDGGGIEITLPYRKPRLLRVFSRSKTFLRKFELDETGSDLWRQIDDRRTVRDLAEYLRSSGAGQEEQALESAVAYVHMLLVRGLVGLVVPSQP